jgi:murein DD-endopeptidase MepM/ murein hydrolase activator NlpD
MVVPPTTDPQETPNLPILVDEAVRTCPDPPPAKPAYDRYWLDDMPWPTPVPDLEAHLWLSHPLPKGDRLLTSEILPYGSDGSGRYLLHNGVDMAEPEGTPVLAVADGTIVYAGSDNESLYGWRCNWYGQLVILLLDDRWEGQPVFVVYGHVLNINVEIGQRVTRFEQVAEIGFGGAALVPHLHLEVRVGSNSFDATRNPLLWLTPGSRRGVVAGRLVDPDGKPWQGYPVELVGPEGSADRTIGWTYVGDPDDLIKPDERFAENFAISDLKPGLYEAVASVQGTIYRQDVTVAAGTIVTVELVTEPYRTPTPAPSATATPQP